jgi:predicted signal transduction protein with EAL and GGDEF domain
LSSRSRSPRCSRSSRRVAIDDFGTGYSALSYLGSLPIDIVKIDRSFVVALQRAGPGKAIAEAIIALVTRLGMTTIGEGIETEDQLEQLSALGCHLGQGFYLARPAAEEDLRPLAEPRYLRPRPVDRRDPGWKTDRTMAGSRTSPADIASGTWVGPARAGPATVH